MIGCEIKFTLKSYGKLELTGIIMDKIRSTKYLYGDRYYYDEYVVKITTIDPDYPSLLNKCITIKPSTISHFTE